MMSVNSNDVARALRQGRRFLGLAFVLYTVAVLGGCSGDPFDWIRSDERPPTKTAENAKADQKFPNLASIPETPAHITTEERKIMSEELIADRGRALYTDRVIRRQSEQLTPSPGGLIAVAPTPKAAAEIAVPPAPSSKPNAQPSTQVPPARVSPLENAQQPARPKWVASSARTEIELAKTRIQPPSASASTPRIQARKRPSPVRDLESRPSPRSIPEPVAQRITQAARSDRQSLSAIEPAGGGPNNPAYGRRPTFGPPPSDIVIVQRARAVTAPLPQLANVTSFNGRTGYNHSSPNGQARFAPRQRARVISLLPDFDSNVAAGERLARIGFEKGESSVGSAERRVLRNIAATYRRLGGLIRVVGHASSLTRNMDPTRHVLVNFQLSVDRANRVARILMALGVPAKSIAIRAMSDNQPRFAEAMPSGETANRRVEVFLDRSS